MNSHRFDESTFRGQRVINRICRSCGLVYQSPRMTEDEAQAFYQSQYRQMYQGVEDPIARDISTQEARAKLLLNFVQLQIPNVTSHLDIGCSTGLILKHFKKQYECVPVGIEPGKAYRDYACQMGLTVYASLEELEKKNNECFTLISMSHVLEHLPDPVGYLVHLREELLDPLGWLLLEVPNLYAHDSFETAHLISYSSHTLLQVVEKAGYELVKLERHGQPRSTILPLYITMLARCSQKPSQGLGTRPERLVNLKRRAGMLRRRVVEKLLPGRTWLRE
jgi:2-polyprenyl-3-methyl-5-hydroxy-6-metoxy-1,4-benzoquinol methylase